MVKKTDNITGQNTKVIDFCKEELESVLKLGLVQFSETVLTIMLYTSVRLYSTTGNCYIVNSALWDECPWWGSNPPHTSNLI